MVKSIYHTLLNKAFYKEESINCFLHETLDFFNEYFVVLLTKPLPIKRAYMHMRFLYKNFQTDP